MYRMGVDGCAGLLAAGQAEETVFHAISCRSNQAKGPGLCPGLVLFPGPGCGLALRVLLFLAVMGHQGASVAVWISSCGKTMGICVRSLYGDSTNVRKKDRRWVRALFRIKGFTGFLHRPLYERLLMRKLSNPPPRGEGIIERPWTVGQGLFKVGCLNQARSYAVGDFHPHPPSAGAGH